MTPPWVTTSVVSPASVVAMPVPADSTRPRKVGMPSPPSGAASSEMTLASRSWPGNSSSSSSASGPAWFRSRAHASQSRTQGRAGHRSRRWLRRPSRGCVGGPTRRRGRRRSAHRATFRAPWPASVPVGEPTRGPPLYAPGAVPRRLAVSGERRVAILSPPGFASARRRWSPHRGGRGRQRRRLRRFSGG